MAPPRKATQRTVSGGGTCSLLRRARPGTGGEYMDGPEKRREDSRDHEKANATDRALVDRLRGPQQH